MFNNLCAILYYLYNLKNMKNTHARVILLVKLQAEARNFTKSITPLWVFLSFLNCANGAISRKHHIYFHRRLFKLVELSDESIS